MVTNAVVIKRNYYSCLAAKHLDQLHAVARHVFGIPSAFSGVSCDVSVQEHLFLVCELLRANLYEFQKYNKENGDEPYFTLPHLQRIAQQVSHSLYSIVINMG